jgi:glycosyltransferase involved in cell wall biosynthesis
VRVLIVHPLGLRFAGYPYIEEKVRALAPLGVEVAVTAPFKDETTMVDGRPPSFARLPLAFDRRGWLTRDARRAITRFDPDLIHVWTPRGLPSRIALEAMVATGAEVIVNYEDPEHLHFEQADGPFRSREILAPLDKANPTPDDVARFLRELPWDWVLATLRAPFGTPFIHPLFFGVLNQCAAGFTGIWRPWVDLLATRFGRPSLLMPLAVDVAGLQPPSAEAIARTRAELGAGPQTLLLLRAGVLYAFVDDQTPMLEGYAAFLETHPEALLVMCGHNYQEQRIAATLARLGIETRVRWLGFLDAPDYAALLHAADVALCPGYPDEYNRFRLAGKIVEYMLAGRPMICYASGIGADLVDGRDALLLDPYTADHVAAQLTRATDPALRRTLGEHAGALARDWFDVAPLAVRMEAFYRACLAGAAARAQAG